ncbi:MAG: ATP-binding cassette domain-containing protein, partial [Desulfovibrio sp.]|nr:ATP-binding cassette domain-containing protein [Desulfovibrio sp.]
MILALRNVSLFYGSRLVFRNVSLELEAGGITLLTGANGAGKTTLLRIMAGLIRPSAGRVETGGPEPRFGYLGHATFLYPGLSLLDNLAF